MKFSTYLKTLAIMWAIGGICMDFQGKPYDLIVILAFLTAIWSRLEEHIEKSGDR